MNIKKAQAAEAGTGTGDFEQFGTAQSELPPQMMIYRFKEERNEYSDGCSKRCTVYCF